MIFFKNEKRDECIFKFSAIENDYVLGECTLDLSGKYADIISVSCNDEIITEGLLKAACNCAALNSFYMVSCGCIGIEHILKRLKFKEESGKFIADIPSVLMGTCCK